MKMSMFEEISDILYDFKEVDSNYSFFITSESDYELFLQFVIKKGYSFSIRHSSKNKSPPDKQRFLWSQRHVPFCGIPFQCVSSSEYHCSQGPLYYKKKTQTETANENSLKKRRFLLLPTKKLGCPAEMRVIKIRRFPLHSISTETNVHDRKRKMAKKLREDLASGFDLVTEYRFYITISSPQVHSHPVTGSLLNQNIHPNVKLQIYKFVNEGITNVPAIKKLLKIHAKHEVSDNITKRSRIFFPLNQTTYNYVLKYTFEKEANKIDQESLISKIEEWQKSYGGSYYFRGYNEEQCESFLFCFQADWQMDMLKRYGEVVLLDATYKTLKYSLPLFNIIVKTNVSYVSAGIFVVQSENSVAISEALAIFQEWNRDWCPKYFVTDLCEAEMNSIKKVFNCPAYVCDFHREQTWLRWLLKKDNVNCQTNSTVLLEYWRKLSHSRSVEDFDKLLAEMKGSDVWSEEVKAAEYFAVNWVPHKEKWAHCYFKDDFLFVINMNNGIEEQHKVLKHSYLKMHIGKSLCGVLEVIIASYLNDCLQNYELANTKLSVSFKQSNEEIPEFLHDRPRHFIEHVYETYTFALGVFNGNCIQEVGSHTFKVSETDSDAFHTVNFAIPYCTCTDFFKFRFPCKHICAIMLFVPDHSFYYLPHNYINSPFLTIDLKYSIFEYAVPTEINDEVVEQKFVQALSPSCVPISSASEMDVDCDSPSNTVENCITNLQERLRRICDLSCLIPVSSDMDEIMKISDTLKELENSMKNLIEYKNNFILLSNSE